MTSHRSHTAVRRPDEVEDPSPTKWDRLFEKALERADGEIESYLRDHEEDPEEALRSLSIISEADLEREFE